MTGKIFVGIGGWFAFSALNLDIGTAFRMGPGYFPLILAGILIFLGVVIVVRSLRIPRTVLGVMAGGGHSPKVASKQVIAQKARPRSRPRRSKAGSSGRSA